mgnify:CR=1 FL=1
MINKMKYFLVLMFIIVVAFSTTLTKPLKDEIRTSSQNELIKINIRLKQQFDRKNFKNYPESLTKSQKRNMVIRDLKEFSRNSQHNIITELKNEKNQDKVREIKSFWIANVINCYATSDLINKIADHNDIARIDVDELRKLISRENMKNNEKLADPLNREITWNVTNVNADQVWDDGYTGEGITVSVIDTGVNYNHYDLEDHMWEDDDYPNHGYDFHNNDDNPMDNMGHGTHCAGTVAGDGTAGSQTGMAPDATIMACKVLGYDGSGYESSVWDAIEFSVENGADVISMSLGWLHDWGPDRVAWRNAMVNCMEANVIAAVAAGNEGNQQYYYPVPDNVRSPGDCPPPWLHPDQTEIGGTSAVVCVGAVDINDNIADFSGRGPVTWEDVEGFNDYSYQPEIGLIRPDITAPGVNIKSLGYQSNSGYEDGWNGTSMATPCVAGVMALMLSKNSALLPAEIDEILENNCLEIYDYKDNAYGSGRVDAYQAVSATSIPEVPPYPAQSPNPSDNSIGVYPGTDLNWVDGGGAEHYEVYFGTNNPPNNIINGEITTENSHELEGMLDYSMQYYWKITSVNSYGETSSEIWSFTTNHEPNDDFETGDFSTMNWSYGGNADWEIDTEAFEGDYSATSGDITHNETSSLLLENYNINSDGLISFYLKTSCEGLGSSGTYYDYLAFYIDGEEIGKWAGETAWTRVTYEITAGEHTFEWLYYKDHGVTEGDDSAWIDYLVMPEQLYFAPPTDLESEVIDNQEVVLNWNAPDTENELISYNLYRNNRLFDTVDANILTYTNENLQSGEYSYYLTAEYLQGESEPSNIEEVEILVEYNLQILPDQVVFETYEDVEAGKEVTLHNLSNTSVELTGFEETGNLGSAVWTVETSDTEVPCELAMSDSVVFEINLDIPVELREFVTDTISFYTDIDTLQVEISVNEDLVSIISQENNSGFESKLMGNYPNPFNPETSISFQLAESSDVELSIYNLKGQLIKRFIKNSLSAGNHNLKWNGKNKNGDSVGSGIYLYKLKIKDQTFIEKCILLK